MKAIILAGGLGSRLRSVVSDVPKPMAPVNGVPFLDYLFKNLKRCGIEEIVLSVCFMKDKIIERYQDSFMGIPVRYSVELEPLKTGGAIKQAVSLLNEDDVVVLNGDTYLELDLNAMYAFHKQKHADVTLAACHLQNFDRYGRLDISDSGRVEGFKEKEFCLEGDINAGIYFLKRNLLESVKENRFSFEEYLCENVNALEVYAFQRSDNFIDIGIPIDYKRAASVISGHD